MKLQKNKYYEISGNPRHLLGTRFHLIVKVICVLPAGRDLGWSYELVNIFNFNGISDQETWTLYKVFMENKNNNFTAKELNINEISAYLI